MQLLHADLALPTLQDKRPLHDWRFTERRWQAFAVVFNIVWWRFKRLGFQSGKRKEFCVFYFDIWAFFHKDWSFLSPLTPGLFPKNSNLTFHAYFWPISSTSQQLVQYFPSVWQFEEEPKLVARYEVPGRPTCLTVVGRRTPPVKVETAVEAMAVEPGELGKEKKKTGKGKGKADRRTTSTSGILVLFLVRFKIFKLWQTWFTK